MRLLYALLAAGTTLTNSTAETVLSSHQLAADHMHRGKIYKVRGCVIAPATNATDTLRVRVRVGPTTLTGTVVADSGAVDATNNDIVTYDLQMTVRNNGSAAVVIVEGAITTVGAEGTVTRRGIYESLTLDATAAQNIEVTGEWSVANAGNQCRADAMTVTEIS